MAIRTPLRRQVHGRRNYQRVALLILYCFYKNVAFVVSLMLYNFYAAFSGTTLYVSITFAAWNVAWTA
jgi:magnesium-transporting ATPase (P-type)